MDAEKPNVLVIDDEKQICVLIQHFLVETDLFNHIIVSHNVIVALQKLQNQKFDLVIVDYHMPNKNGTEFISSIRRMIKYRDTKVLLISGYLNGANMAEVLRLGVKDILVKPFYKTKLVNTVCQLLELDPKSRKDSKLGW
jgi:response regulator of citrate/malate metabolism